MPTEAQWEYACRAGTTTALNNGQDLTIADDGSCADLNVLAWYDKNSGTMTHPVGQKWANNWGFFDMHGNVCEWCNDWMGNYHKRDATDPQGPKRGSFRVVRGGDYNREPVKCRSAYREGAEPGECGRRYGFRLAAAPV